MPLTCPKCGAQNRDTARFCTECAEPLVDKVQCPFCGFECPPQANFCMQCATPLRAAAISKTGLLPPSTVLSNRYTIIRRVGHGGMGAVYEAQDSRIPGKRWAIKELSDAALTTPKEKQDAVEAFRREAQMLALLDHPNLPAVSDFFSEGGKHYLVMEFVDGHTIEEILAATVGFLDEHQVLAWVEQICAVLAYLHRQNPPVIFRDLKPGNVMVDRSGQVKLIDFGIARLFKAGKSSDTQAMGTPGYAAPEQFGKGQTDRRSDIYSLGVMLHQLLTCYDPAHTPFNLPPPQNINPNISPKLVLVIQKATQTQPLARYQDVAEMKEALKAFSVPTEPVMQPFPVYPMVQTVSVSPSESLAGLVQPLVTGQPGRSWWKAALVHLVFGFGLFYADKRLGRKRLYPLVVLYGIFAFLDQDQLYLLSGSVVSWDIIHNSFFIAVGLYLLSFIDVILTSQAVYRGAKQVPDPFSWWKALGSHLFGGFGLAYVDSGLKRKFLYPLAFFLAVFAVVDLNAIYVISDMMGWEPVEITLRLAVLVYLFSFIDLVLTGQAVSRGSNPLSGHLSWWQAIGLHLVFGFGLASIDSSIRRRWLYPVAFFCSLLIYIDLQEYDYLPHFLGDDPVIALFLSALVIYLFGFIDVILTQQSIARGSKNIPDVLSWVKALGLHFCGGYGLAYIDNTIKRKWLYLSAFLLLVLRLIVLLEPDFLFPYPLDHFLYDQARQILDLVFYVSLAVFVLGIADVLLTCRSRMKTHP